MNRRENIKTILSGIRTGFIAWTLIGLLWGIFILLTHLDRPFTLLDLPLFRLLDGWQVERVSTYKIYVPVILDRLEFLFLTGLAHAVLGLIFGLAAGLLNLVLWRRSESGKVAGKARSFTLACNLFPFVFLLLIGQGPTVGKGVLIPPLLPSILGIDILVSIVIAAVVFWLLYRNATKAGVAKAGAAGLSGPAGMPERFLLFLCIGILLVAGISSQLGRHLATESLEVEKSLLPPDLGRTAGPTENAILIIIDTLRADHLGCYGYDRPLTPRIDELAGDGIRFENCISQAPWTIPSIMSIMTSMYPSVNGVRDTKGSLDPMRHTLAEAFQAAGYRTAGIVSHTFVDSRFGFGNGFDIFEDKKVIQKPADQITDLAISTLEGIEDGPFFLFIHYFDPHFPYEPPAPYDTIQVASGSQVESMTWKEMKRFAQTKYPVPQKDLKRIIGLYDGEIAFTDAMIGRLIDYLKSSGLYDKTIIALTADHGEEFKDHGSMGHTRTLYDELIHVPLLIHDPGSGTSGTVISDLVRSIDIAPTLLRAVGIGSPPDFQGIDLSVFWSKEGVKPELTAFSETSRHAILRSVRTADHKYIQNIRRSFYHQVPGGGPSHEFYDLARDEKELHDLGETGDPVMIPLRDRLFQWTRDSEIEGDWLPKAGGNQEVTFDRETLNRLRSLGYVQ